MVNKLITLMKPKIDFMIDKEFYPAVLWNHSFLYAVYNSKKSIPLYIALQREDNSVSTFESRIFSPESKYNSLNYFYVERLVKILLWMYGGYKISINGPAEIGEYIKKIYSTKNIRAFDANFMSTIYEKPFRVIIDHNKEAFITKEKSIPWGGNIEGFRIGFDLGASDRKVSAIINGKSVFSEETIWNPSDKTDPRYHYHEIMSMLHHAAAHIPRVDAIGGSSAGIYMQNQVKKASIFRGISPDLFEKKVKNIFIDIQKEWGVPFAVINDGDVTALAGSMFLKISSILGIALGSSEAGGYIDKDGNITGRLNELAFVPIDFSKQSFIDEWSGDYGCGSQYLSQVAVVRLAKKIGITVNKEPTLAEKLKHIQKLLENGDERAIKVFETIGIYLGYSIAHYADFYDIKNILILGRVTSGKGGQIILEKARNVLKEEFKELFENISLHLPDESIRRVGQSIAAASLPTL